MKKEKQQHKVTPTPKDIGVTSQGEGGFAPHRFSTWKSLGSSSTTFRHRSESSAGFTLLYSVLVTSLLLAIGLSIFNIAIKEVILSSGARDSQFAFYAADAGLECAFYWDIKRTSFATSTEATINCRGRDFLVGGNLSSEFTLTFEPDNAYCAIVTVTKSETSSRTIIQSRGFNTCDVNNPRRVERALRATY